MVDLNFIDHHRKYKCSKHLKDKYCQIGYKAKSNYVLLLEMHFKSKALMG